MDNSTLHNQYLLVQIHDFLKTIKKEEYIRKIDWLMGASVGMHIRHILEFYACLLKQEFQHSTVCYDERMRNPVLENDPTKAAEEALELIGLLSTYRKKSIQLKTYSWGTETLIPTHFERELLYLSEHTVHHMASIRFAMNAMGGDFSFPENFGIAPSTIQNIHQSKT